MDYLLLIEPDKLLADTVSKYLNDNGYQVVCSDGAQDAILKIDKKKPQLIILEVLLAEHNGIEFLYEMRSYPDLLNIPVIIFSRVGSDDLGISEKLKVDLMISNILYKPDTTMKKLLDSINDLISR